MGLKTTYYLRTLAATQIEKSTLDAAKFGYTQKREYLPLAAGGAGPQPCGSRPKALEPSAAASLDLWQRLAVRRHLTSPASPEPQLVPHRRSRLRSLPVVIRKHVQRDAR